MVSPAALAQGVRRRTALIAFVRLYVAEHGYAPSMAEMGLAVGLASLNSTRNQLHRLVADGYLEIQPGLARAIRLVDPAPDGWRAHDYR